MALSLGARQRKRLIAESDQAFARAQRAEQTKKLRTLREHIRNAKRLRTVRLREVRGLCKRARARGRERAKEIRAAFRAAAQAEVDALKTADRQACESRKVQAIEQAKNAGERAAARLVAELEAQRSRRKWARKERAEIRKRIRAAEQRAESDDEVAGNLPAELEPVWRRLAHKFKGSEHRSRTEAFTEWAAQHAGDVRAILDEELESSISDLIRAEAAQRRALGQGSRRRRAA